MDFQNANRPVQKPSCAKTLANGKYDAFGLLIERDNQTDVQRYAYDGWNPGKPGGAIGKENFDVVMHIDDAGSLTTRYEYTNRIDSQIGRVDVDEVRWTLTDHQGSVREVIDNDAVVKDSLKYDAFGNITAETDAAERGWYTWTGRDFDAEADLQYNRERWYNGKTGRWQTRDPLGFDAGDSNLYRYVNNRPTYAVDPSGLEGEQWSDFSGFWGFAYQSWQLWGAVQESEKLDAQIKLRTPAKAYPDWAVKKSSVDGNDEERQLTMTPGYRAHLDSTHEGLRMIPGVKIAEGGAAIVIHNGNQVGKLFKGDIGGVFSDELAFQGASTKQRFSLATEYSPIRPVMGVLKLDFGLEKGADNVFNDLGKDAADLGKKAGKGQFEFATFAAVVVFAGPKSNPLMPGEAGSYSSLSRRSVVGDGLTPHHMPQAALEFTAYGEGGALVLTGPQHAMTRNFAGRGVVTAAEEAGLPFRTVLVRDIRDVRRIVGTEYNQGLLELLDYYRVNFPQLMARPK